MFHQSCSNCYMDSAGAPRSNQAIPQEESKRKRKGRNRQMSSGAGGIICLFRGRPGPRTERRKAGLEMEKGGFQSHFSIPRSSPVGGAGYGKFTNWDDAWRLPLWLSGKESACNAGDTSSIPGWGRSPGGGRGNPLQCACLENPMNRGDWQAIVRKVTKSQTWLNTHTHTHTHTR